MSLPLGAGSCPACFLTPSLFSFGWDLGAWAGRRHFCREQLLTLLWWGLTRCRWVGEGQEFKPVAVYSRGSVCCHHPCLQPWLEQPDLAWVAEGRDGERPLPPAVPLVAFALPAAFSLASPALHLCLSASPSSCPFFPWKEQPSSVHA